MSLVWSHILVGISCLLVGVVIGKLSERKRARGESKRDMYLSIGLVVLGIVSVIGVMIGVLNYSKAANCQATYNQDFAVALKERQSAAEQDRAAQKRFNGFTVKMLITILNPNATTDKRRSAVVEWQHAAEDYGKSLEEADKTRGRNPLPDRPGCR